MKIAGNAHDVKAMGAPGACAVTGFRSRCQCRSWYFVSLSTPADDTRSPSHRPASGKEDSHK